MGLPIILAGDVTASEISFDARFRKAYAAAESFHKRIASETMSNTRVTSYPIQARLAKLRKWTGERQVQNAKAYAQAITNEKFELTLGIPVEDFEDDQLGVYAATIDDMGENAKAWPDDVLFDLINAGETELAYDGVAYFSSSHSLGGHTIDNHFAATALSHDNFGAVRAEMAEYVDESGQSLRVVPDTLMVPPALEQTARQILMAENVPSTTTPAAGTTTQSNVWKGMCELLVVPQLAAAAGGDDDAWYLLQTKRAVKPFIWQVRKAPVFAVKNAPTDESVFNDDRILYGVRARGNAGLGPFWLAAKAEA